MISEDVEDIVVEDELIEDKDSEALELTVEGPPGYDTGNSIDTAELGVEEPPG